LLVAQKKSEKQPSRPKVKCPYCDYTCKGKQPLGRHITLTHPERRSNPKVSLELSTLKDILKLVNDSMPMGAEKVIKPITDAVVAQEIKVRLTLASVALDKADRITTLGPLLAEIDNRLVTKLTEKDKEDKCYLDHLLPQQLLEFQSLVTDILTKEAAFLERILSMRSSGSSELFTQLIETLKGACEGANGTIAISERIHERYANFDLGVDARERLRRYADSIVRGKSVIDVPASTD